MDARTSLAVWLRQARVHRKLSLDDVSRVTKIQPRILEKLESGQLEGLPAEVFVRGFVRSFARCVGLDEAEALKRYGACADCKSDAPPAAKALVESMSELAPATARTIEIVEIPPAPVEPPPAVEPVVVASEPAPAPSRKKQRNRKRAQGSMPPRSQRRDQKKKSSPNIETANVATTEPEIVAAPAVEAAPVVEPTPAVETAAVVEPTPAVEAPVVETTATQAAPAITDTTAAPVEPAEPLESGSWRPTMPPLSTTPLESGSWRPTMPPLSTTPSVPWRRPPAATTTATAPVVPTLIIDDADPEQAERVQEARGDAEKEQKLSFLPPILLDREDRSARQGTLTLAVIILLIAATLTLSYLMRRPSAGGDGVTLRETPTTLA